MKRFIQRRTALKVRNGKVQPQDRTAPSADLFLGNTSDFIIAREKPGRGFRHLLQRRDVERFIQILPQWPTLSSGLHAVLLAEGEKELLGWHAPGIVGLCAWDEELWVHWHEPFYSDHQDILTRLRVPTEKRGRDFLCKFTERTAVAFQLLHVFLHELGHHYDRITTRSRREAARGEGFAEEYARRYGHELFERFAAAFPL